MKNTVRTVTAVLLLAAASFPAFAADYTTFLTQQRGFTEVTGDNLQTPADAIIGDADYYYILAPAESHEYIVGVGRYELKPGWATEESKALRLRLADADPIDDLTNFFTIEKSNGNIGLRNAVYDTDLFQTHNGEGYMYVNTFTDRTLDEWSYLIPHWQSNGYWLFENGKYPLSSEASWKGYMGSWTAGRMADGEPIALNRLNTDGDPAGHYRLFRIARRQLMALRLYRSLLTAANGFSEVTTTEQMSDDPTQCYLITSADAPDYFVGIGKYEAKPDWAGEDTKALRYRQMGNPIADLSNFFTIEKENGYIGLRNVKLNSHLFQTHTGAGFMYVLTYTEQDMSEWTGLRPVYQNGYWLFENGKYPAASTEQWRGYMGPWTPGHVADGEPIALNRMNTTGDEAGHYRLWRISRSNLFSLMNSIGSVEGGTAADMTWKIVNPSFEQGETGWTLKDKDPAGNDEFKARDYGMTGRAGGLLMNAYQWWASSLSVSQTVNDLPAGRYNVAATVASWAGRTITMKANYGNSVSTTGINDVSGIKLKTVVDIAKGGKLPIAVGSTTDWWTEGVDHPESDKQCFFKVDDLQLTCTELFLDAFAVPLPGSGRQLVPGQWYYYDVDHTDDYVLIAPLEGLVYALDGTASFASTAGTPAQRQLTLPAGRAYFRTSASETTLDILPLRSNKQGTFSAAALNVDGLPNKIAFYDLNPDGPGRDGTLKISQYLASKQYDFIGCSEDFNYNGALMESLDGYSCGTIRNTLSVTDIDVLQLIQGKIHVDTDGLNLLWKNSKIAATNESWTKWNSTEATDGNQFVTKGYRHYDVQIDGGPVIDVFILHMDAGDTNATWSRESQWQQLAGAINNTDHSRPKLIIGDTNSRYTREDIIGKFTNLLSTDFTMSDVWVEKYRNGIYPNTSMDNLTDQSDPDNYTDYEIVDKIIYINPKAGNTIQLIPLSFTIEHDYTYDYVDHDGNTTPLGDHHPVVVTFKYVQPDDMQTFDVSFADDDDNTTLIDSYADVPANATITGRHLIKDGSWNTLCLPFDCDLNGDLAEATLMELDTEGSYDGHVTGLDGNTLYLNFKPATSIKAGVPYVVKWDEGTDIFTPTFSGITIPAGITAGVVGSGDGTVSFKGTFSTVVLPNGDKTNLYLGDDNMLYWPTTDDFSVNAFHAFFKLNSTVAPIRLILNFNDEATGISDITDDVSGSRKCFDLQGRQVDNGQLQNGFYILDGRKFIGGSH